MVAQILVSSLSQKQFAVAYQRHKHVGHCVHPHFVDTSVEVVCLFCECHDARQMQPSMRVRCNLQMHSHMHGGFMVMDAMRDACRTWLFHA